MTDAFEPVQYTKHNRQDFDAIVTGELAHYAIWMEEALAQIIASYFCKPALAKSFKELVLRRDGMTFQNKIDLVRTILSEIASPEDAPHIKQTLNDVDELKEFRNALAHGLDVSPDESSLHIVIETISRTGKPRKFEITPENHAARMNKANSTLSSLDKIAEQFKVAPIIST